MEMNEVLADIYDYGYTHQFQPGPTHKIRQQQQQKLRVYQYHPENNLLNDHGDRPN